MFLFCLLFAMSLYASVYMCFVVTCWERADLLTLVCGVYCEFVTFPIGILGQVWYLIVSIPDLCILTYFNSNQGPNTKLEPHQRMKPQQLSYGLSKDSSSATCGGKLGCTKYNMNFSNVLLNTMTSALAS